MRILIVEDEHKIANSIKQGLEQEGYSADTAYTGTDGYDLASTEEYDLIILDIMLPGMNGLQICTNLRKNHIHTPVLMLSARAETEDKITGLDTGADDYLSKPFAFTELLARSKALLRRPNGITPKVLTCADLTLDTQNFTVTRSNKNIDLSKKEFALLEYLLRHKNQIVSKDKIIEHVWDYDSDILPNTVEVYIGYLRKKVDKPFDKSLLKTIRGFGYKIEES
ncbi:response regulator transcription factor [candidate division WWE3 bacterium]|uniref:Response regulator transcription factor n=1 Tax=candidate division WWE3 bacterium TaxID=2053526 RepID=A0A955ECB2_UNCKA|nr:response regulator transcription factor [candidate division WWE3 bacterium]